MANGSMITKDQAQSLVNRFRSDYASTNANAFGFLYDFELIEELKNAAPAGVDIAAG